MTPAKSFRAKWFAKYSTNKKNMKCKSSGSKSRDEVVKIENNLVLQYYRFQYLGATIERDWDFQLDIANRSE